MWLNLLSFPASIYLVYMVWQKQDPVAIFVACLVLFLTGVQGLADGVTKYLENRASS
jgi:hypothetical protein